MTSDKRHRTAIAVTDRTDPYLRLAATTVSSDRIWRWGDDNLFPRPRP